MDGGDPDAAPGVQRDTGPDLVVVSLPGVRRFVEEARSIVDVSAASGIYSRLTQEIVESFRAGSGGEFVLPTSEPETSGSEYGMPNRVVALLAETGDGAADRAVKAVRGSWEDWIWKLLRSTGKDPAPPVPEAPGFPLQWVCVSADVGGYEEQWRQRALCLLAPCWPAENNAPPDAPPRKGTALSLVDWVKRRWAYLNGEDGFPSAASIVSVPYGRAILEHLTDGNVREALGVPARAARAIETMSETSVPGLKSLIPDSGPGHWPGRRGGPWVCADRWQSAGLARRLGVRGRGSSAASREELARIVAAADAGHRAAAHLRNAMAKRTGVPLTDYLVVVVQDIDSMGRFLSGVAPDAKGRKIKVIPNEHRQLSAGLFRVAAAQHAAVLFFHYHASIQCAVGHARRLLKAARKQVPGKHARAVGCLRRSRPAPYRSSNGMGLMAATRPGCSRSPPADRRTGFRPVSSHQAICR